MFISISPKSGAVALLLSGLLFLEFSGITRADAPPVKSDAKKLGTIFNNDINNILLAAGQNGGTAEAYQRYVERLLDMKPGVLAQNVGLPDPVIYCTSEATTFDKYLVEVSKLTWPDADPQKDAVPQEECLRAMFAAGTDPLAITVDACRRRGILVIASYRMNAEDWYQHTWRLSDFGRAHPEYRIPAQNDSPGWAKPFTGNLDPAIPEVYEHRMKIFREVVEKYDIDGLEFDFRRWYHMVSNPEKNHTVLTRMLRDARAMLDEATRRKGRSRLLLGVRVSPSLDRPANIFLYPGAFHAEDSNLEGSCRYHGLDVQTWIKENLVDYICPSQFLGQLPGLPFTEEFTALTKNTRIGVYPTLWPQASWMHDILGVERPVTLDPKDIRALALYKYDLCSAALQMVQDGADGISTYNWYSFYEEPDCGNGAAAVQRYILPFLSNPAAIREYLQTPWALPPGNSISQSQSYDAQK